MSKQFPHLFTPGRIGNVEIKNRICKAPQTSGLSHMDGSVSERLVRYYEDLAKGEVGMIIVEYAYVDRLYSKSASNQLGICDDEYIVGLGWLADSIKNAGSVPCIQIEHCGRQRFLGPPMKSASPNPWPLMYQRYGQAAIPEELTIAEIHDIVEAFGKAAKRAKDAGFEVVEIHGAHGYLITNFLSPFTNQRTDWYGGSRENRFRFLEQIFTRCKEYVGEDFPLIVRLSGTDYEPGGMTIEDTIYYAKRLEELGCAAIDVSGGDHHQMIHQVTPMQLSKGHNVWAAEAIKKEVSIPVFATGSITLPEYAEEIHMVEAATYFYLAVAAGTLISRIFAGRIYDSRGPNVVMIPAFICFIVGMVVFAEAPNEVLFLGAGFIIGFAISIVFSICQSIVVARSPPRRYGVTTSTFSALNDLGTGIGPSVLGVLITAIGYQNMYLTCAGVACVSMLMYWTIHGRREGNRPGRDIIQDSE